MARNDHYRPGATPQDAGHPTRSDIHEKWRHSVLVGPQTAGIPTVHNEDEWARDGDALPSNNDMVPPRNPLTPDGGALDYHDSQRRK